MHRYRREHDKIDRFVGRPRMRRHIGFHPRQRFFKPQGIPIRNLEVIEITAEEAEAMRLKYIEDLDQTDCARRMKTSQSTFQRLLVSANKKITTALIRGKAIKIGKSNL